MVRVSVPTLFLFLLLILNVTRRGFSISIDIQNIRELGSFYMFLGTVFLEYLPELLLALDPPEPIVAVADALLLQIK